MEVRQTTDMASQISSYVSLLEQAGFQPNAKPMSSKRDGQDIQQSLEKRNLPNINLVISLLEKHGFQPASNKTTNKRDDSFDLTTPLAKRDLPDINLVISILKQHGFVPSQPKTTTRSVEERQAPSEVNYVINQLIAAGYNPNDFGPTASKLINSFMGSLPTETIALCPKDNNTLYATGGQTYEIFCGFDFPGNDLPAVHTETLAACLGACSAYVPNKDIAGNASCVAASWGEGNPGGNCYMKYKIGDVNNNNGGLKAGRNVNTM